MTHIPTIKKPVPFEQILPSPEKLFVKVQTTIEVKTDPNIHVGRAQNLSDKLIRAEITELKHSTRPLHRSRYYAALDVAEQRGLLK